LSEYLALTLGILTDIIYLTCRKTAESGLLFYAKKT